MSGTLPHGKSPCSMGKLIFYGKLWKNMSSSIGMMKFPTEWKNKIHVPNHQSLIFNHYFDITRWYPWLPMFAIAQRHRQGTVARASRPQKAYRHGKRRGSRRSWDTRNPYFSRMDVSGTDLKIWSISTSISTYFFSEQGWLIDLGPDHPSGDPRPVASPSPAACRRAARVTRSFRSSWREWSHGAALVFPGWCWNIYVFPSGKDWDRLRFETEERFIHV